jgi:hypothetical protein
MVAPLDPIRGPSGAPQTGSHRANNAPADAFALELQRLLEADRTSASPTVAPRAALADDLTASLDGVSDSLRRATAHINSARAYFRGAAGAPTPDTGVDTRG